MINHLSSYHYLLLNLADKDGSCPHFDDLLDNNGELHPRPSHKMEHKWEIAIEDNWCHMELLWFKVHLPWKLS
jgi:hypothetical protein